VDLVDSALGEKKVDSFFSKPLLIKLYQDKSIDILIIKKEIKKLYGLSIVDAIKDYQKFHTVMQKIYGKKADHIEKKLLNSIAKIERKGSEVFIYTNEMTICQSIINSFGDQFKRLILDMTKNDNKLVFEIIKRSNIPQASGYRRVKELVDDCILFEVGKVTGGDGRNATKYINIFDNVQININEIISVKLKFKKQFLDSSFIYQLLKTKKNSQSEQSKK